MLLLNTQHVHELRILCCCTPGVRLSKVFCFGFFWGFFLTDCELGDLKDMTDDLKEDKEIQDDTLKLASGQ